MDPLGALLPRHVFVDLETTGLDPSRDEVIELGALFVEEGRAVRSVSRLFSPSRPLPAIIRLLTGIDDAELLGQPAFSAYRAELREALRGWTVVAHNAAFERSFLAEVLSDLDAPVLDTCELLHYLYPELESHSLDSLVRWSGVAERAAHRALQDCIDTFGVVRTALERCIADRRVADLDDLLQSLGQAPAGAEPSPLVVLLGALRGHCGPRPDEAAPTVIDAASSSERRAARAYLRAFARRSPDGDLRRLSRWFRQRFPELDQLAGDGGDAPAAPADPSAPALRTGLRSTG